MAISAEQWCADIGKFYVLTHLIRMIISTHPIRNITLWFFNKYKIFLVFFLMSFVIYSCDNTVTLNKIPYQRKKLQPITFHAAMQLMIAEMFHYLEHILLFTL